ncbi:MAG: enoyl-CoA hydratase-related protein [Bacteroidota bacterium]
MDTTTTSGQILVTRDNQVTTITISNPKRRNAISNPMATELKNAILSCKDDDSRVVILTGDGDHFCAGADLDPNLVNGQPFDVTEFLRNNYNPMVMAMREMDKIFIAKVRGNCVGAAFNFVLACDLIYSSTTSKFSQIFTRIGLSSDGGGAYFMPERLGYHKSLELMALNKMVMADEAEKLGLVNQVIEDSELDEYVRNLANSLKEGPFIAIRNTKRNLRVAIKQGLAAGLEMEAISQGENFKSNDFFEGISAFVQKRKPNYKGE